ncbi:MAG TPA: hypothetical protein PLM53_17055 [Spirochaetota bacterium]|nr:hypothetical protein [Spirochaetota bacterium]HPC42969.1 hypothetical protein [Spirochaetota bacterium]HPL18570.1 hypothetical protein [Spirochaetota bacterium]HQF10068.1 hypothetical protein [Spirochaetota bacterium]HQH98808.1 hypothetical protein [Spirochaetota bacterium]
MLHKIAVLCVIAAFLFGYVGISHSQELDKSAGAENEDRRVKCVVAFTAYYANWAPVWKKYRYTLPKYSEGDFSLPKGTFMYGPSLSITIDRWQISGNFLYGEFEGNLVAYDFLPVFSASGFGYIIPYSKKMDVKKYDCDLLVSYQINSFFKIFFGPKYQGYQYKTTTSLSVPSTEDIEHHSGGLGVGIGCTLPIAGDFYLMMNFSGVVLVGMQKGSEDEGDRISIAYGGNETIALTYYIRAAHIVISAGGRLQYLYFHTTPSKYYLSKHDIFLRHQPVGGRLVLNRDPVRPRSRSVPRNDAG